MSFDELKRRLYIRLKTLNLEVKTMHEEVNARYFLFINFALCFLLLL